MFSQRLLARAAAAAARPAAVPRTPSTILRSPILRRRLMSTEASGTKNAFIKEREAIEHHAGQTAGRWQIAGCVVNSNEELALIHDWL